MSAYACARALARSHGTMLGVLRYATRVLTLAFFEEETVKRPAFLGVVCNGKLNKQDPRDLGPQNAIAREITFHKKKKLSPFSAINRTILASKNTRRCFYCSETLFRR